MVTTTMEACKSAAVSTLTTLMETDIQVIDAYNIYTNYNFDKLRCCYGDLVAYVVTMEEEQTEMMDEIKV